MKLKKFLCTRESDFVLCKRSVETSIDSETLMYGQLSYTRLYSITSTVNVLGNIMNPTWETGRRKNREEDKTSEVNIYITYLEIRSRTGPSTPEMGQLHLSNQNFLGPWTL